MRPLPAAALAALLVALPATIGAPPAARAGDEAADASRRLRDGWTTGLEAKSPEEVDSYRKGLLEPLAVSGSPVAFEAVLAVAHERAAQIVQFKERLKKLEEGAKEEQDKGGKKPEGGMDSGAARNRVDEEARAKEDREKLPGRIQREERWQPRLAEAEGAIVDALSDPDFAKVALPRMKEALGDRAEGWDAWLVDAFGRSRKERTARVLLDDAEDALKDYRKALANRVGPAKELDKVNDDINKIVLPYLEKQQKLGDFSATIPGGLIPDQLLHEQARLQAVVTQLTFPMEAADQRRRTERSTLGRMLAGASEEVRGKLLDLIEKEALTRPDFESRAFGLRVVGPCPGDRPMKFLREAAKDPNPEVVVAALDSLAGRSEAEAVEILAAALPDPRWQVRAAAAAGLAESGRAAAVPPLVEALARAEWRTVDDIHDALVKLTGKSIPAVAGAWEEWWKKEGANFKGPKDPGGGEVAAGAGSGQPGGAPPSQGSGERVSFYGIEAKTDRMLFILDCSGSMNFAGSEFVKERKKIDILREEMKKSIAGLPDGAKFNMIVFSSDVRVWHKGPAVRDAKIAKDAIEWVEKQKVVGSTNMYDALETAFKMMGVGASTDKSYAPVFDTIFFMTDGVPTSGKVTDKNVILGEVRRWNEGRKIRIHVVGMGGKQKGGMPGPAGRDDIDKDFLQKLADQNGGQCVFR
jgi:uncharacterized protein YegL